jgi:hypothetical protein
MQLYNTDSLHKFGLNLSPQEREQLIAFLKTLKPDSPSHRRAISWQYRGDALAPF